MSGSRGLDTGGTAGSSAADQLGQTEAHPERRMPRSFASNGRDGARLLSSALVITGIGLVRLDHPAGRAVALLVCLISLYWWRCYRQIAP